jgi:hypothetical protein
LVDHPALDTLDVGGDLVNRRGGFGHVAGQFVPDVKEGDGLPFDGNDEVFDLCQGFVKVPGQIADLVF